jgi:hypothetical protein
MHVACIVVCDDGPRSFVRLTHPCSAGSGRWSAGGTTVAVHPLALSYLYARDFGMRTGSLSQLPLDSHVCLPVSGEEWSRSLFWPSTTNAAEPRQR